MTDPCCGASAEERKVRTGTRFSSWTQDSVGRETQNGVWWVECAGPTPPSASDSKRRTVQAVERGTLEPVVLEPLEF